MIRFVSWDFRGGLSAEDLIQAIGSFEHRPVYAVAVDTGGDDYTVALSDHPISAGEARAAWLAA